MRTFVSPTGILIRSDTLPDKDCGRCNRTMFPEGKKKAFGPDTEMMNHPW